MKNVQIRYVGLDLLRGILMLIGPIFHIGLIFNSPLIITNTDTDNELVYKILSITHPFRMELFFIISGFFSSYIIENKGLDYFWRNRKSRIFFPLMSSILILLPFTHYLYNLIVEEVPAANVFHIWFIITMSAISVIYYFLYNYIRKIINYLVKLPSIAIITITLVAVAGFYFTFNKLPVEKESLPYILLYFVLYSIPINLIITILGSCLYYKPFKVTKLWAPILPLVFLTFYSFVVSKSFSDLNSIFRKVVLLSYYFSLSYFILYVFNYFKNLNIKQSRLLTLLVNSSLTIYLVHQPFVYLNIYILDDYAIDSFSFFIMLTIATYLQSMLSYLFFSQFKLTRKCFGIKEKESISFLINFPKIFIEETKIMIGKIR